MNYVFIHVLITVMPFSILEGCRTKQASVTSITDIRDEQVSADSMVSASLRVVIDSIVSREFVSRRDCVVIVVDETGNILATNRWQLRDRDRKSEHYGMARDSNVVSQSKVQRRERQESEHVTEQDREQVGGAFRIIRYMKTLIVIVAIVLLAWYIYKMYRNG